MSFRRTRNYCRFFIFSSFFLPPNCLLYALRRHLNPVKHRVYCTAAHSLGTVLENKGRPPPPNENGPFCLRQYWSYLLSHVPLRNAANKGGNKARDVGHQMPRRGSQDKYCSIMQNNVWAHSRTPGTITKKWVNQRFNYSALPTDVVCGSSTWRSINSWFAMQMFIPANDKGGFCGVANRQEFWRKSDHEAVANRTGFCV